MLGFRSVRAFLTLPLACLVCVAYGDSASVPLSEPKALLRIVESLEKSKIDGLVSDKSSDGGTETYHLKSIDLLGTVTRNRETFYLAEAFYIRSRPFGSETPPARGHSFLVVLSSDFAVASHCYGFEGGCRLKGNVLMKGDKVLVDFGANNISARHHGYALGQVDLPYFFSDKITDEQWEDEDFMKKEMKQK